MSQLKVGDIIYGFYVDLTPRFYKIVKITEKKIRASRLKYIDKEKGRIPGSIRDDLKEVVMTKKDELSATHYGMIYNKMENPKIPINFSSRN